MTTKGGSMSAEPVDTQVLQGRSLVTARILWIVFAVTLTALQILSQLAVFRALPNTDLSQAQLTSLQAMSLTAQQYNFLRFVWEVPNVIVWGGLGLLIFLRKSNERGALVISAMMIGVGMAGSI